MRQIEADTLSKWANARLRDEQHRLEGRKVLISAVLASSAVFGVIGTFFGYVLRGSGH